MVVSSFSRHTFSCPCELAKAKPRIFEWVRKPYAGNAKQSQFHCLALHGISLAFSLLTLEHFKNLSFQNMLSKIILQKTRIAFLTPMIFIHFFFDPSEACSFRPYIKDCILSSFTHIPCVSADFL